MAVTHRRLSALSEKSKALLWGLYIYRTRQEYILSRDLPHITYEVVMIRLVVGEAFGMSPPIKTYSLMFYLDIVACEGSVIDNILGQPTHTSIYPRSCFN